MERRLGGALAVRPEILYPEPHRRDLAATGPAGRPGPAGSISENCMGLVAAIWKASGFGQPPSVPKLGKAFNFDIMADGDAVIGFGNLSCSSQVPIT